MLGNNTVVWGPDAQNIRTFIDQERAIRFVMEDLTAAEQETALILSSNGADTLRIGTIRDLYEKATAASSKKNP